MKLIFCPECEDVVRLYIGEQRKCMCGKSHGMYVDVINAKIGGKAIPLGFLNDEFVDALIDRPKDGNGYKFTAFVIPYKCNTVEYDNE